MSRLRNCLASIALACSFGACTKSASITPVKPVVVNHEQTIDRAMLRAKLAERRELNVKRFLAYRESRIYPVLTTPGTEHLWYDAAGHLCAAATMISADWGREVTMRVGAKDLHLKLADVTSGPLADWILTSGLAKHEIVAIQVPPMGPGDGGEWQMPGAPIIVDDSQRLYQLYTDVERQIRAMWVANLDDATDALMKRPDLARAVMSDQLASPGMFAQPIG